jgi:anion-transporting  ArsA/GET3 family ATPase
MTALWHERSILVTVGTGGVGKTTVAAAIGLGAARSGRHALVLTIDPAQRLADALGVGRLDHEAREIPREVLKAAGCEGDGTLSAMMLDTKRTFDELVARYAPNEEVIEQILENPIYRNLTDALAGSREYSAMEMLYQLKSSGKYDLIVLDTPPAAHALDFLEAPRRLTGFLDSQILRLLFRPALAMGRTGFRLFRRGSDAMLQIMERVTGMEFLRMVAEFVLVFESLWDGVSKRAKEIEELLREPECGFVLIAGPDPVQARRAESFWSRLAEEGIHLAGVVLNRVRVWPPGEPIPELPDADWERIRTELGDSLPDDRGFEPREAAANLVEVTRRYAALAERDRAIHERLAVSLALPPEEVLVIPLLAEDVHALSTLAEMSSHMDPGQSDG